MEALPLGPITSFIKKAVSLIIGPQPTSYQPTALGNDAEAPIWKSASNLSTSGAANSWYVENGSYLRLQNLSVNYELEDTLLDHLGITDLTLGIAANNIWTLTKYQGLDPQVGGPDTNFGIDVGNYPVTPSYLFTIRINK